MLLVEPGLYIGDVATAADVGQLAAPGITHVLTVDTEPPVLPEAIAHLWLPVRDDAGADLLSNLDRCDRFIREAVGTHRGAVLVHCHAGVSRSAAVVTAYLMKTKQLQFQDAYSRLQSIKPDVKMNEDFVNQLLLYEMMGCEVDISSSVYKQYRLQKITEKFPELQGLPQDVFAEDPNAAGVPRNSDALYRCRKCRRCLFHSSSILSHVFGIGVAAFSHKKIAPHLSSGASPEKTKCTSYFIEPVRWMESALLGVMDGQLLCPKCSSKLGSFNWYGDQCSCGRWITPAFQIHKNRVDEVKQLLIPGLHKVVTSGLKSTQ
ncbi:dual specificity protein phosphatase 12 [Protopterus annectens]|uniref:dual specificity protein phosphatase 12 n=1 Tax=Protopterus annectens TaxID=7888 RepID=UPI001CFB2E4D|nr:dual specificity protein phosphatase 12 [Protopterus annectens]